MLAPSTNRRRIDLALAVSLVLIAVVSRIVPHPWNLTPLVAIALFGGATIERTGLAAAIMLGALALGDAALGLFPYDGMAWVYGASVAVVLIGRLLGRHRGIAPTLVGALAGGALFYVVTNFGVWATGHLYPHTAAGLVACYVAGVPFYRHQVIGDLAYTALLFGSLAAARKLGATLGAHPAR
ncbi:MAG: DUF6580 family putative transport protein [Polyangiaceae bacterium]